MQVSKRKIQVSKRNINMKQKRKIVGQFLVNEYNYDVNVNHSTNECIDKCIDLIDAMNNVWEIIYFDFYDLNIDDVYVLTYFVYMCKHIPKNLNRVAQTIASILYRMCNVDKIFDKSHGSKMMFKIIDFIKYYISHNDVYFDPNMDEYIQLLKDKDPSNFVDFIKQQILKKSKISYDSIYVNFIGELNDDTIKYYKCIIDSGTTGVIQNVILYYYNKRQYLDMCEIINNNFKKYVLECHKYDCEKIYYRTSIYDIYMEIIDFLNNGDNIEMYKYYTHYLADKDIDDNDLFLFPCRNLHINTYTGYDYTYIYDPKYIEINQQLKYIIELIRENKKTKWELTESQLRPDGGILYHSAIKEFNDTMNQLNQINK